MFLHLIHGSVADPGQYSTDPGPADVKKTDPDPADIKKRIRILVKYCTHKAKNETSIFFLYFIW